MGKTMKKFTIIGSALIMAALCFACIGCSKSNNSQPETKTDGLQAIKIGNSLPDLVVTNLGLGELYNAESSNIDAESDNADKHSDIKYKCTNVEYYATKDKKKELHVSHYDNPNKLSLEEFTKSKSFDANLGYNNYRMGQSEVYALSNHKVEDGYFVKCVKDKSGTVYICQRATYADGDNFVIVSYLYPCTDFNIPETNVHASIPIMDEATVKDEVYGTTSKSFSYDKKTELPTMTYYITSRTIEEALQNYTTSYNAVAQKGVVEGVEYGIAMEQNAKIDGTDYNITTLFVKASNGKTVAIEVKEIANERTYAFFPILKNTYSK